MSHRNSKLFWISLLLKVFWLDLLMCNKLEALTEAFSAFISSFPGEFLVPDKVCLHCNLCCDSYSFGTVTDGQEICWNSASLNWLHL